MVSRCPRGVKRDSVQQPSFGALAGPVTTRATGSCPSRMPRSAQKVDLVRLLALPEPGFAGS